MVYVSTRTMSIFKRVKAIGILQYCQAIPNQGFSVSNSGDTVESRHSNCQIRVINAFYLEMEHLRNPEQVTASDAAIVITDGRQAILV